jgi:hypothetical protein
MSIKNLYEIASLVTKKQGVNQLFLADNEDFESGLKYKRLLEGIMQEQWKSDEEAKLELYGNGSGAKTFDMLKSRAKERLISMIFQSDSSKTYESHIDRAFFSASKTYLIGMMLFRKSKFSSGQEQFKLALKTSREFQFYDLEILILRQLRKYASFSGNEKNFSKYCEELRNAQKYLNAELEAEELELELLAKSASAVSVSESWMELLDRNLARVQVLSKEFKSISIRVFYYKLSIRYFQAKENYEKAIDVITEYQEFLMSNPKFDVWTRVANAALNKLYCAVHMKDYHRGNIFASECEGLIKPGSVIWLIFKEYHFLLCMHASQIGKASSIFNQVLQHPTFAAYPAPNVEKWRIFEAYLDYAEPIASPARRKFNVSKFLNEVPVFSKDKGGYNLSIIIAQILLEVKTNELHRIVDREESLKIYLSRYINKEKQARSYYFIKMLQVMIRYEFDPIKTAQIADKFLVKMKQSGNSYLESSEVIPYEWLWSDLMARLREIKSNIKAEV